MKKTNKDMLDIAKTGVVWGASSSIVSSITPSSGLGKTTGDLAQAGLGLSYVKHISKKMKL